MNIKQYKLADYVGKYPGLLPFLDRLGIELGFGEMTITEICKKNEIDLYFFIELINLITKKYEFDSQYSDRFDLELTVRYLKNSHKSYLNEYLPKLRKLINSFLIEEPDRTRDLNLILKYLDEYENEFRHHLNDEDQSIYPYVLSLSVAFKSGEYENSLIDYIRNNSISNYLKKHDSLDDKLSDLKNLIIKYFKPFKSKEIVHSFLKTIFELEEDLQLHELIENHILFKQAKTLEDSILSSCNN